MKRDLSKKADIEKVIHLFYDKVQKDEVIGPFFTEIFQIDWETHSQKMCCFWESVIFYTGEYEGNPLDTHRRIHQQHPTKAEHFNRWLELFAKAVDTLFAGPNAEKMKRHSKAIATVMQQKI